MADVFISYSKTYADVTRRLAGELEALGLTIWWDTELVAGESYRQRIQEEIAKARAAIVIWTPDSINSEFVISEASRAHAQRKLIQVRTSDVEIKDLPAPFDVSHVPLVDDRRAITGALRRLGLLAGTAPDAEAGDHDSAGGPAWKHRVQRTPADLSAKRWLPVALSALMLGVIGYVGLATLMRTPRPAGPVAAAVTVDDPAKAALAVSSELLRQLNAGLTDTSILATDVRLSQRGLMSRVEAADELRKLGARFGKVSCRLDNQNVELRSPEHSSASFRAKIMVLCDLTDAQGRMQSKRFPLEVEAVRTGERHIIAGLWQPEEQVLWQRRERGN